MKHKKSPFGYYETKGITKSFIAILGHIFETDHETYRKYIAEAQKKQYTKLLGIK
ncbi:MAG TPA: hypothetical protein PK941_07845 [Paludibacter sp.]|nr:hypothetical protein [Paludibacter sp.]